MIDKKKKKKFKEKSRNNSQGGTKGYTSIQIRHSTNFKRSFEFVKYSRGRKKLPFTLVLPFTCKWAFVKKFNSKARAKMEASPFETKLTDISPPSFSIFLKSNFVFQKFPFSLINSSPKLCNSNLEKRYDKFHENIFKRNLEEENLSNESIFRRWQRRKRA